MRRSGPVLLVALVLLAACGGEDPPEARRIPDPYPFVTPTPAPDPTGLDGTYVRAVPDAAAGPLGKCKRCPPYRLELGDTNTLTVSRGVFRFHHDLTGWESAGHVFVEGDTATLINDPNCIGAEGVYRWRIEGGALTFELVSDDCAFSGLRSRYLTAAPWERA